MRGWMTMLGAALVALASPVEARIVRIEVQAVEPFAPGTTFGGAGAYVRVIAKAYGELEYEGLAAAKPGVGTFVTKTLTDASIAVHQQVSQELLLWYRKARAAGLDAESIDGIYQQTVRSALQEEAV